MSFVPRLVSPLLLLLTVSCGGGGGGDGASLHGCSPIAGSVTGSTSPGCLSCGAENLPLAADGNAATYGSIEMPDTSSGSGSIRVTAPATMSAGTMVGMVHSIAYGPSTGLSILLTTYLSGAPQEVFSFNNGAGSSDQSPSSPGRASFATSLSYDAVELSFSRGSGTGGVSARVHEFCSN